MSTPPIEIVAGSKHSIHAVGECLALMGGSYLVRRTVVTAEGQIALA